MTVSGATIEEAPHKWSKYWRVRRLYAKRADKLA
jgi:hypothetical protein